MNVNKQKQEMNEFKNSIPFIKKINSKLIENIFLFFVYVYLFLCAINALRQIFNLILIEGSQIIHIFYYLLIVIVTIITFFRKKGYNWIILDLILINVLN